MLPADPEQCHGCTVDELILSELIESKLARLHAHFGQLGLNSGMVHTLQFIWILTRPQIVTPWLQTLFVAHLNREDALKLWGVMLISGVHFMHSAAMALLKINEDQLVLSRIFEMSS